MVINIWCQRDWHCIETTEPAFSANGIISDNIWPFCAATLFGVLLTLLWCYRNKAAAVTLFTCAHCNGICRTTQGSLHKVKHRHPPIDRCALSSRARGDRVNNVNVYVTKASQQLLHVAAPLMWYPRAQLLLVKWKFNCVPRERVSLTLPVSSPQIEILIPSHVPLDNTYKSTL